MTSAINDATKKQVGTIYQFLIALRDCFELRDDDTLLIETYGDISVINSTKGLFQKEVKHHFTEEKLAERNIDFWKTLANWYTEYNRVKDFSNFILSTTAIICDTSPFFKWNFLKKEEKLKRVKAIGAIKKVNEKMFRTQFERIFNDTYDENRMLNILDKFTLECAQLSIKDISKAFSMYVGHIPEENRDGYIGALLGEILIKVKNPPHRWEVTKSAFEQILQKQTASYGTKGTAPLPNEFAKAVVPENKIMEFKQKKFVKSIQEIEHEQMILEAISDYWKTDLTIAKYFKNNFMYLESLEDYIGDLFSKMNYAKSTSEITSEGFAEKELIKISKQLYNNVMGWDANDFGSIIRNQGFFQHGVIHNIVDEKDFKWKVGIE